jgi:hypothetical protein
MLKKHRTKEKNNSKTKKISFVQSGLNIQLTVKEQEEFMEKIEEMLESPELATSRNPFAKIVITGQDEENPHILQGQGTLGDRGEWKSVADFSYDRKTQLWDCDEGKLEFE